MPTNEEGEFELVLGNRQLLSVFFIVVVLLGLFFTMGYIVGRSGGPKAEMASNRPPSRVIEVGPAAPRPGDPSRPSPLADPFKIPESGAKPAPVSIDPPKVEGRKPEAKEAKKPEPPPKPEPPKVEVAKPQVVKPEPARPEVARVDPPRATPAPQSTGGAGRYLQVSATTKADGEALVRKLAGKGFSAITTPVPNSDLVRVMVGPITAEDFNSTKEKLAAAGHADAIPRRL